MDFEVTKSDGVAILSLNRPQRRNAFTIEMIGLWADALIEAQRDSDVGAIVVTGAGGSFCSGVDLDEFTAGNRSPLEQKEFLTGGVHRVALALEDVTKPVLAAVTGPAMGAGLDMALLCDIRFAGRSARFSESYINVGLVPGDGGCWLLPRSVGTSTALRLLWTGDVVEADEALRIGLVEAIYDDDELMDRVLAFAHRLATQPPVAVQMIKRAVRQGANHDLRTALDLVSSHLAVITTTQDSAEAFAAARAKRPGVYVGR
jgi:enoyl-CoA hydratase/carnithine racemase